MLDLVDSVDQGVLNPLSTIEAIAFNGELSDAEKVQRIQNVLRDKSPQRNAAFEQMTAIKTQVQSESEDADYYEVLARKVSVALTPRSSPVSSKTVWQKSSRYSTWREIRPVSSWQQFSITKRKTE